MNWADAGASPAVTEALALPVMGEPFWATPLAVTVSVTVESSGTAPVNVQVMLSPGRGSVAGTVQLMLVAQVLPATLFGLLHRLPAGQAGPLNPAAVAMF